MGNMVNAATKKAIRADVRYVRQMLRQIEAALRADDLAALTDAANEASCAAVQIMEEATADGYTAHEERMIARNAERTN